jgi:putative membrane protein
VAALEKEWLHLADSSPLKNITTLHSLLGFALSMLLVFRTNTAYDRWWEGRRLWGSLVNNSRNMALKLVPMLRSDEAQKAFFASAIPTFAVELMRHLRSEVTKFEMDERPHPEIPDFDTAQHVPAQAACMIIGRIYELHRQGTISPEELLLMNAEMSSLMDICGACERIRNTPIPYSYSAFIKKFIFVYVVTLPFGFAFILGYLSMPVVALIFYILASLELIAEEIEEPFGADQNDLPMDRLCRSIEKTVREILS